MRKVGMIIAAAALTACVSPYEATVNDYTSAYQDVSLGMTPTQVNDIMVPTQRRLANSERKQPEKYLKEGVAVDILYFRSGWQSDGLTTDDEFTPYIFNDGKLVAVGWQTLGGPESVGQARDVNIQQPTQVIVY